MLQIQSSQEINQDGCFPGGQSGPDGRHHWNIRANGTAIGPLVHSSHFSLTPQQAIQILTSTDWEVDQAVTNYYESLEGGDVEEDNEDHSEHTAQQSSSSRQANAPITTGGGRTLGGETIPSSTTAAPAQPKAKPAGKSKGKSLFSSFRDIRDRDGSGHDDDDEDKDQEFYAGGDKSGLAVQEPGSGHNSSHNDQVKRLLETARR